MKTLFTSATCGGCALLSLAVIDPLGVPPVGQDPAGQKVAELFAASGIGLDVEAGICALPARIEVRNDLLEYLLVGPHGAVHESLFVTTVDPELLNTAFLTLGVKPGTNATWTQKNPPPTEEELRAGVSSYDVSLPAGDGFFLYVSWREGDEAYLYRMEDLIRDLDRQRSMQRHRWVYMGSRMVAQRSGEKEVFAASAEGNLVNIAFFSQGNTLVTAALDACVSQSVWLPNAWLLPERESTVLFVFSKERLDSLPGVIAERVPRVDNTGETVTNGGR